ncbi:hypothetical protein LguiB_013291 [Lonicera macranthoides]
MALARAFEKGWRWLQVSRDLRKEWRWLPNLPVPDVGIGLPVRSDIGLHPGKARNLVMNFTSKVHPLSSNHGTHITAIKMQKHLTSKNLSMCEGKLPPPLMPACRVSLGLTGSLLTRRSSPAPAIYTASTNYRDLIATDSDNSMSTSGNSRRGKVAGQSNRPPKPKSQKRKRTGNVIYSCCICSSAIVVRVGTEEISSKVWKMGWFSWLQVGRIGCGFHFGQHKIYANMAKQVKNKDEEPPTAYPPPSTLFSPHSLPNHYLPAFGSPHTPGHRAPVVPTLSPLPSTEVLTQVEYIEHVDSTMVDIGRGRGMGTDLDLTHVPVERGRGRGRGDERPIETHIGAVDDGRPKRKRKKPACAMASSSSNNNPDGFSYIDEINLCLAWKQVTRDGTWCERDNPKTWERMAAIFNAEPKAESSLWNDRVVTPEQLAQLWAKVEPAVAKWNRFYNEKERPTPHPKFLIDYPGSRAHYLVKFSSEVEKEMEEHADLMYLVEKGVDFAYKMYWRVLKSIIN